MGRRLGWTAVRGASIDEVARGLGCQRATGRYGTLHITDLPSGWALVDSPGYPTFGEVEVRRLSTGREALIFEMSETAGTSSLVCFRNGARAWSICNNIDEPGDVVIVGTADPIVLEEARIAATLQRGECPDDDDPVSHGYEAIAIIAERLTGYNLDLSTGELRWVGFAKPPAPVRRALAVDGEDESSDPTLDAVRAAVSAFAANPHPRASVKLGVIREGKRFTLHASVEDNAPRVVALGNGRAIVRRLDGSALEVTDLMALFTSFYEGGERSANFRWVAS